MPPASAKQHPDPKQCPPWLKPNSRLMDQRANPRFAVERWLETPTQHDQWDTWGEVSMMDGRVTYWSQTLPNGGWNTLLLVDPCLKDPAHLAIRKGVSPLSLTRKIRYPELEDHEKVEIAPNPLQWHPSAAFTRYDLHDDILIHFAVADTGPGSTPFAITPFVRGFVISKWIAYLNHIDRCYGHTRTALFSSDNKALRYTNEDTTLAYHTPHWGGTWKEWMFESMTRMSSDLVLNRLCVETNMRALGIDVDDPFSYGLVGKREAQMWRYIRATCEDLQQMFKSLTDSYTQVIALREAQTSNVQAESVRWLTILGTFFVPLSVVAGVMSMGDDFLPGKSQFWVYFAVTGPLLLIIGAILSVVLGYVRPKLFGKICSQIKNGENGWQH